MFTNERLYTADDLLALPSDGIKREPVRGEIIEMTPSGDTHSILSFHTGVLLSTRFSLDKTGYLTVEGGGYILFYNPDTVRAPDVGYISKARLESPLTGKYFPVAPDFAIEMVSPIDAADEIQEKVVEYLSAGTKLVWAMYPKSRTVAVHTPSGSRILDINGVLDGGDVLPGLSLPVRDIFAVLDEEQ